MGKFELLPKSEAKRILEGVGKDIVTIHKRRLQNQVEVDGSPMPSLSPHTEERKIKKGGRSKVNASKRMVDTGDFMQNAFQYKVDADGTGLEVYISNDKHEWKKQSEVAKKEREKAIEDAGGFNKWAKSGGSGKSAIYTGLSYKTIAKQQLRGEFGNDSWRHAKNPGAKFFGLNEVEKQQINNKIKNEVTPIVKKNLKDNLDKIISKFK
jgi:hypothetical protein